MYKDKGGSGSKAEVGNLDHKRINDALDKNLGKSSPSPSTSRGLNGKKGWFSVPYTSDGKQAHEHQRQCSGGSSSKNKCSNEESETGNEE